MTQLGCSSSKRPFGQAQFKSMSSTFNSIYPRIYAFDTLYAAYLRARRGKRKQPAVQRFEQNLEGELIQLQNELIWQSYQTSPYRVFLVHEPKRRQVAALPFRDRIVQQSLIAAIEPIWERRFIDDSYACRPGRGTHRGADRAQLFLRQVSRKHGRAYALKADIAKYFASIDHGILRRLLRRHIACSDTLWLCDEIIASTEPVGARNGCGLPIGNLTSQLWANIYLHELDRFAKHELKARRYVRYMDDFVLIHHDKKQLHDARARIEKYLWSNLRLQTNSKTQVYPISRYRGRGLDFLGYRIWPNYRKLRRDSVCRMKKSIKSLQALYADDAITLPEISQRIASWKGHAQHANSDALIEKLFSTAVFKKK